MSPIIKVIYVDEEGGVSQHTKNKGGEEGLSDVVKVITFK